MRDGTYRLVRLINGWLEALGLYRGFEFPYWVYSFPFHEAIDNIMMPILPDMILHMIATLFIIISVLALLMAIDIQMGVKNFTTKNPLPKNLKRMKICPDCNGLANNKFVCMCDSGYIDAYPMYDRFTLDSALSALCRRIQTEDTLIHTIKGAYSQWQPMLHH